MTDPKKPNIAYNPADSSNVESFGHCPETNTIGVKFKGGAEYHYPNADSELYSKLVACPSTGRGVRDLLMSRGEGLTGVRQPMPKEGE